MCGIVGAIAQRDIADILLEGLKRLEYRGYDSAGMAIIDPQQHIQRLRVLGKVEGLEKELENKYLKGHTGIAHTRWATHGQPNEANAHPHCSHDEIAVVHNGIIENHTELRDKLSKLGYKFCSDTDTEVIGHLLHHHLKKTPNFIEALHKTTAELQGAYALGIISSQHPDCLFALRCGSPLVVGLGIGEHFIASDPVALLPVTQQFIYLEEGDIAQIDRNTILIQDKDGNTVKRPVHKSNANADTISKGQFRHFMLKEIYDQPQSLSETLEGYLINGKLVEQAFGHQAKDLLPSIERIKIIACGTSYHAGLVGHHWLESIANVPCQVEVASEYRYRKAVVEPNTLFVAISQSGETADTLAALRKAKESGYTATLGICNVPESTLAREADLVFITRAGTEIGVAATKTFTAQLVSLLLLALVLGQQKQMDSEKAKQLIEELRQLPNIVQDVLKLDNAIKKISKRFSEKQHALFLGRGEHHPIALEGALKLKEISYMHAEAYPAGELKHGPLALVDEKMPVIVVAPHNTLSEKLESNIQEVRARGGDIYVFADEQLQWNETDGTTIIKMPKVPELLAPIAYTIPLQLLSYHIAVLKGTDVDQPRNLAKSVTVE